MRSEVHVKPGAAKKASRLKLNTALVATALLCTQLVPQAGAQGSAPNMAAMADSARLRLAPLKWMVGEWTGPATGNNGGQSYAVTQHEKIIEAANGTVLLIQGRGMQGAQTVFEAAGLLSFDMGSRQYKWVSSGGTGYVGISDAEVRGDTLVWYTPGGQGSRTRYIIWKSAKGEWRETGEVSRDNATWTRIFEMTLVRK